MMNQRNWKVFVPKSKEMNWRMTKNKTRFEKVKSKQPIIQYFI